MEAKIVENSHFFICYNLANGRVEYENGKIVAMLFKAKTVLMKDIQYFLGDIDLIHLIPTT